MMLGLMIVAINISIAPSFAQTPLKSSARAVFKLSQDSPGDDAATKEHDSDIGASSSLAIEAMWSRPKAILEKPSPDASVNLRVNLIPGDERMASFGLWRELSGLMGFLAGLKNEGITWMARDESADLEAQIHELIDSVRNSGPGGQREKASAKPDSTGKSETGWLRSVSRSFVDSWSIYDFQPIQTMENKVTPKWMTFCPPLEKTWILLISCGWF